MDLATCQGLLAIPATRLRHKHTTNCKTPQMYYVVEALETDPHVFIVSHQPSEQVSWRLLFLIDAVTTRQSGTTRLLHLPMQNTLRPSDRRGV